jgi:hypothetical protein
MNYWVIDKDNQVKISLALVKSMVSFDVSNANSKSDIDSHWLPTAASLPIMDPNQPEPLIKLPIRIEPDSLQYHTSMLIDSTTNLNFRSHNFLIRNNILGKCTRGPKIIIRITNEQKKSTS